jgi:hypothetical protein
VRLPRGYAPLRFRGNQRSGRRIVAQGACNRPTIKRPFIFVVTSGQRGEPPREKRANAPRLSDPSALPRLAVQLRAQAHTSCNRRRLPCAKKPHRRLRQCFVFSGLSQILKR